MKKYEVQWTETTYYSAIVEANNPADAQEALLGEIIWLTT
jgi:hypothetical protein